MREWVGNALVECLIAGLGHAWGLVCLLGIAMVSFIVVLGLLLVHNAGPLTWRLW